MKSGESRSAGTARHLSPSVSSRRPCSFLCNSPGGVIESSVYCTTSPAKSSDLISKCLLSVGSSLWPLSLLDVGLIILCAVLEQTVYKMLGIVASFPYKVTARGEFTVDNFTSSNVCPGGKFYINTIIRLKDEMAVKTFILCSISNVYYMSFHPGRGKSKSQYNLTDTGLEV